MRMWYQNPLTPLSALGWCWTLTSKDCSNPLVNSRLGREGKGRYISKRLEGQGRDGPLAVSSNQLWFLWTGSLRWVWLLPGSVHAPSLAPSA